MVKATGELICSRFTIHDLLKDVFQFTPFADGVTPRYQLIEQLYSSDEPT